jgi:hypothetical protein
VRCDFICLPARILLTLLSAWPWRIKITRGNVIDDK